MNLKVKLTSAIMAFLLVIGLFVIGVFAASKASVGINGSVSFVADDVYCTVSGKISGIEGGDKTLPTLNFSSTQEDEGWESQDLVFVDKNTPIVLEITIENLSQERSVYVDLKGYVGVEDNVEKALKLEGNVYQSGEVVEITKCTESTKSIKVFTIELSVDNANFTIKDAGFDYEVTLNNYKVSSESVESYQVDCEFYSIDTEYTPLKKAIDSPFEGENVYLTKIDDMPAGYIDFGEYDISNKIAKGEKLKPTIYLNLSECQVFVNGEEVELEIIEDFAVYSFEVIVNSDLSIQIVGDLFTF